MAFDIFMALTMWFSTFLVVQVAIWTYLAIPALIIILIMKAIQKVSR